MAAFAPDSPAQLLDRFRKANWKVVDEGKFNWLVEYDGDPSNEEMDREPFVIPKEGEKIGFDLMRKAHTAIELARKNGQEPSDPPAS